MPKILDITGTLTEIARVLPAGGDWCTVTKAHTLASIIIALRPVTVVEIGVWMGGSAIPMMLAMRAVADAEIDPVTGETCEATRTFVAIDPWSATASLVGEDGDNAAWWSTVDHEAAYETFVGRVEAAGLAPLCEIVRKPSDEADVPHEIDLLHIDGNHREQAIRDVMRFAAAVSIGGILVMDDVGWKGESVAHAVELARTLGFVDLYPLDSGLVMQRKLEAP